MLLEAAKYMGWSWKEIEETPIEVIQYVWTRMEIENKAIEKANRKK